ncbi:MAG: xanthan lyase [Dysgonamonadaceae bacterium]|jgi:hypothetical protein|nr:xanthan lyase [Dysgonamonadaceae bacterium]
MKIRTIKTALHIFLWCGVFVLLHGCAAIRKHPAVAEMKLNEEIADRLKNHASYFEAWRHVGKIKLDSVYAEETQPAIDLYFSGALAFLPIRESYIDSLKQLIKTDLGPKFQEYDLNLYAAQTPLESYIPAVYRLQTPKEANRPATRSARASKSFIENLSKPVYASGLSQKNIALWPSHGWYYEASLDRWEWQRARLFGTVEDLNSLRYILPLLAPMLENAGATTFLPRDRDPKTVEVIVDNDRSSGTSDLIVHNQSQWRTSQVGTGFAMKDTLTDFDNPFRNGTYLYARSVASDTTKLVYCPDIPEDGEYAVHVSWSTLPESADSALYTISYAGGSARFLVNQQSGGGTWIYLGMFPFRKGKNGTGGSIELSNIGRSEKIITADAIRIGGGYGSVARRPAEDYIEKQWSLAGGVKPEPETSYLAKPASHSLKLSGKSRYQEGARYFLQYAGMPRRVYSPNLGKNDYNDDYQGRGDWVNYLMGEFYDSDRDSLKTGLNIPIDLSFAFHTDAGVTSNDSVIGTLAIYCTFYGDSLFPGGGSRMASRDLSDLVQTQIVSDLRAQFNPRWTRRGLWDKAYSEAWKPKAPALLLELLSHQNLADSKYNLDPRYRFAVCRAIYKGMLRFLAGEDGREYVVQPLPPDHFAISLKDHRRICLSWQPVADTLEPTAVAKRYRVYTRKGDLGFDQGVLTDQTSLEMELPEENVIYSFRVTAVNDGGESFPSETLAVCLRDNPQKPVLIVNAFDRISGPAIVDNGSFSGIAWWDDEGIPAGSDLGFVGNQYLFNRKSNWTDDDSPGWGASYADKEGSVIPGNTFDNVVIHGRAIANAGYSFVSMSHESFEQQQLDTAMYAAVDIIFGEQRATPAFPNPEEKTFVVYTPEMRTALQYLAKHRVPLFISGAYIGSDMVEMKDTMAISFAKELLHYSWRTNHADNLGFVTSTDWAPSVFPSGVTYNTGYHPSVYRVESPDAIEPEGGDAVTIFRYGSNQTSAGVYHPTGNKTIVLGFPFETILKESERNHLMKAILATFETDMSKINTKK